jgi:hypothetical protein
VTEKQIIAKLNKKSGKTAAEVGVPCRVLRKLAAENKIRCLGPRKTGQRGRPALEFARLS